MSEYRLAEKPTLDALTDLGYRPLSPEAAMAMRQEENRVILKPVLIEALRALNGIGAADAEAIYGELSTLSDNEEWQKKLRGAYSRRISGETRDRPITLIDFKHSERNRFHVVRQFRVAAQRPRIADIVVFVNGIPLVVIEAKCPLKATAKAEEAFEQIRQYERDIPRLFYSNAFNLVTDGITTLYGATGSSSQFYAPWPDAWPRSRDEFPDDLSKDLWCLLEPARLLDILAHFIVFETDPESGRKIKKVCRYQQFRAVNRAVARVAEGRLKKGLIWHTQGSGKSLTMVFLVLKLKNHLTLDAPTLENPNILVLTDRIDLDDQISKTFVACGLPNPKQAASVKELREAVAVGGNGQILLSTIFKFAGSMDAIPNSENWIVLVDECHRTQEKDLGAYLQATLPDARYFGLTGTPIKSTDKDTYARFSEPGEGYLDKYGIDDAVRDGATVPILYEGRKTDWSINEAEIDILFDRWFVDLPDEKREQLKSKGLTLATIAKHPERVRLIALDIWEHFKQVCRPDGFKAQIVVVDREAVVLYRMALSHVIASDLVKGGMDQAGAMAKADAMIACVFSKSQEDNKPSEDPDIAALRAELEGWYLDDAAEKDAKKHFKAFGEEPSFLIVCDKLLTGFDAPIEAVMYLDKPLKEHGLLQAIARTNRTCSLKRPDGVEIEKPHGRIVDYIGVTNHLDEALASYRAEDVQNSLRDIAVLRNDLKEAHARYARQKRLMGLDGMDEKAAAYAVGKLAAEGREDDWFELQRFARNFVRVYGDLSPDPAILEFTAQVKWAAAFLRLATQVISKDESLDHKSYTGKIRDMLEEHVHATGLSTTIRLRSITDPNFADDFEVEEKTDEELQEAFVRKSAELRRVTRELVDKNPAQYGRFSERVLEIIRRFEEGQIAAAEGLKDFEDLAGGINAEQGAHADLGIDERAFSILRIMEALAPDTDHASLQAAAMGVGDEIMFASVLPDLLAAAAGPVTCVVDPRLVRLLSHALTGLDVRSREDLAGLRLDDYETVVALGSLPAAFRRSRGAFPGTPYLRPRAEIAEAWAVRLGARATPLRIGLSWRGGLMRTRGAARSLPLSALAPLLNRPDCSFVSLQYGDVTDELAAANARLARPIQAFPAAAIDDFEDLAALTGALDAVVTVQTTLAHLTGAIGQRGLVMIPQRPEWRYMAAGPTLPWYGSLELFRQAQGEDWAPVIVRVGQALDRLAAESGRDIDDRSA